MSALAAEEEGFWVVARQPGSVERDLPIFASRPGCVALRASASCVRRTDYAEGIFVLEDALDAGECAAIVAASERMGYGPDAPVSLGRDVRRNANCVWIVDDALNDALYGRCEASLPPEIRLEARDGSTLTVGPVAGLNRRWRLYKYEAGDAFEWHTDGGWSGSGVRDGGLVDDLYDGGRHSWLTFLIYLTDDFEGGETEFAPQHRRGGVSVAPRRGSVLCFPHGYHPLSPLHRGAIVSRGVKYVARTDVLYAMPPP